jgi:hypothetical protein
MLTKEALSRLRLDPDFQEYVAFLRDHLQQQEDRIISGATIQDDRNVGVKTAHCVGLMKGLKIAIEPNVE